MTYYNVETKHGVLVDVKLDLRSAKNSAAHGGNNPRYGKELCRIYTVTAKGTKVYLD